jgi:iron complex transport system ATP-binding protein
MIEVRRVAAGYGGRRDVLRVASLRLAPGAVTGVLGPNGGGKTTLLRILARLLPPRAGTVHLGTLDLYRDLDARTAARRVALVPQEEPAGEGLTVRDLVELGRTPYVGRLGWLRREDRLAAERAMRETDVLALADRPADALSGGERKRAIVARALAQEASVLLLDEPTAHLDARHALDLAAVLRRLAAKGRTVVIASHELWLLARTCDRLLLISGGRLAVDGPPARVLASPACERAFGVSIRLLRAGGVLVPVVRHLH